MRNDHTPSLASALSGGQRRTGSRPRRWATRGFALLVAAAALGSPFGADAETETLTRDVQLNPPDQSQLIDLGASTFDAAVAAFLPASLPLKVPGLEDLGPISIPASQLTIERPDDPLQVGGWIVRFEGGAAVEINGSSKSLTLMIELEWEDANADHTPTVELAVASADSLTVDDVMSFSGGLVTGAATQESLDAQTAIDDVALAFRWDGDGSIPRRWFDITGGVVVGQHDLALRFLYSADSGGPHGDFFISAVRLDSTDPDADSVRVADVLPGSWGAVAGELELSQFVLAKVSGLPAGETIGKNDLRIGIPTEFFAGCDDCADALPDQFELGADLTLLAKFDLTQLGGAVAEAFDYAGADSVVDLYGKVGVSLSEVEGGQMNLDHVSLRADVPTGDGNSPADWIDIGDWTFTIEYEGDLLTGGITVGAATTVAVESEGFQHTFATTATLTRTVDGTISVGATATSDQDFENAFGLDWIDLDSVGLSFSFTQAGVGDAAAFDAALTSTFALGDPESGPSTVGTLEARLGVTDEARVQFRLAFGEGDTNVPIGAVLATIANQFEAPDLGTALGGLALDDLAMAITVTTSGDVSFETFAETDLGAPFGTIAAYFYAGPGTPGGPPTFFFGARPTSGLSLGELLAADGSTPPPVIDTIELPTLGIVAVPLGGFNATSAELSVDGFRFFRGLYGCPDAESAATCGFDVALEPGVNLLANIAFPGQLADLAEALWLDPSTGIQFQGTLALPGLFDPGGDVGVKLGLRLTLPRIDPHDAAEFLEDGSVTLGIELVVTPEEQKIALFVRGELNTRWRRGVEPVAPGADCPYTSVPLEQYETDTPGEPNPTWCYDRLTFAVEAELALTPTGVTVSLLGGLSAPNGWQAPFGVPGLEWLVVNELRLKLEVQLPGPSGSGVTVNAGFLGEIEIDNPEPGVPNTVLQASFGAGVTIQPIPGPPGVSLVPNFKGVRAYVSRVGMADVAALQHTIFPNAPLVDVSSVPNIEFQNVEFMFAIASDPDLCLEPRIGFAGELWVDPQRTDPPGGEVPEDQPATPCRPFGALVDPLVCLANQDLGCFASTKVTIGLDGIFASGAVGSFELGPIAWQDGFVDLRLKIGEAPIFAISGGIEIDGLGSGELALKFDLLQARVEFFGELSAFGAFDAEVSGALDLGLQSLFPPDLDGQFQLHAALRADFESAIRAMIAAELQRIAGDLEDIDEALDLLADDPIANLGEARDALEDAGVDLPPWLNDLVDYVELVTDTVLPEDAKVPTYDQLLGNEPYTVSTDAFRSCHFGDSYDPDDDECHETIGGDDYEPDYWCAPTSELHGDKCRTEISFPPIGDYVDAALPDDLEDALADVYDEAVSAIKAIDLVPNISGLGIDEYLHDLADQIEDSRFLQVDCAAFDWKEGDGAGEISVQLRLTVLDEEHTFDVLLDLTSPQSGVETVVSELIELFLGEEQPDVTCVGAQPKPDWLETLEEAAAEREQRPTLTLTPAGPVDEGQQLTIHGSLSPATDNPIDVTVDWGDGNSSVVAGVTGSAFTATHSYDDDDPTFTGFDLYTVRASSPAADGQPSIVIRVDNVAPVVSFPDLGTGELVAHEGQLVTLRVELGDVPADVHRATVRWGDGTLTRLTDVGATFEVSHTYADDNPSGTPFDVKPDGLRVTVVDDDGGVTTLSADVRLVNELPAVWITGPATVEEGLAATYHFVVGDVGLRDTQLLLVAWGDGTITRTTVPASRVLDLDHTYADDDPTATPSDPYTITAVVIDDDTGVGSSATSITVRNVNPVVEIAGPSSVTVQYSDPIGGDPHTGTITGIALTAHDVTPDVLTVTAVLAGNPGLPGWLSLGTPSCTPSGDYHRDCTWTLAAVPDPVSGIHTDIAPGTYTLTLTVTDDDTGSHSDTLTIRVLPEDARTWYQGPTFAATESAADGDAALLLRATVRDITSAVTVSDSQWDPWPGDIRKATMSFDQRPTAPSPLCTAPAVDEVFAPFDVFIASRSIGIGTCVWVAPVPGDAFEYTIGTLVGGYYTRDATVEDTVVTVARPLPSFITGGGYLVLSRSSGVFAGADGTHANFGFHVKFNKQLTNLQGGVNIIVRHGGRVYQIKSNATDSIGVSVTSAQFEAKASITDVTNPHAPVTLGGNYVLQMRMNDLSTADAADQISFALWDVRKTGSGKNATTTQLLLFSSNWDGNQTVLQQLAGGNLFVHAR